MTVDGKNDVLTMALGKPEHGGRVRGQGSHVKQSIYFDLPRQKKARTIDDRIQEGVKKFVVEETTRIIKERDEFWAAEIEKIRSELRMAKDMPQKGSPYNYSHQGSCSDLNGEPRFGKEDPVKKKLNVESEADAGEGGEEKVDEIRLTVDLNDDGRVKFVDNKEDRVKSGDDKEEHVKSVDDKEDHVKSGEENDAQKKKSAPSSGNFKLAIGSISNIVAHGKIDEVPVVKGCEPTLHGVRLGRLNARVSITHAIQGDVKIPFPVGDEIVTVQQAIGTFIAWPRELIVMGNTSNTQMLSSPKVLYN